MARTKHNSGSILRSWFSKARSACQSVKRPKLTQDQLKSLAMKMREAFKWDADPKEFQLSAVQAQIEGVDMIVQAPTGSGKTALAAGPHVWPGNEKKFTLMVCPLLSLEEEMVQTFHDDFGLKAVALNSSNGACSPLVIKEILALKYQIILISPEMLQSRRFMDRVLRNSAFMRNIISMFIDEAHCIAHWGADFRKKYGSLGKVRVFFPRGTPVIAVTATLTARVRRTIHHTLGFAQSELQSRFVNKGNDRPNVSIIVRACEHPQNSYADLDFVIPHHVRQPLDIPKTYIYVDNISVGGDIIGHLNQKLAERWEPGTNYDVSHRGLSNESPESDRLPTQADSESPSARQPSRLASPTLIRPFNATLSQEYRSLAMAHFRRGDIRVLVCTDAAGMGCNIPDIDRVVQWKLPATFSNLIQRAGRAARGRSRTGVAILLVEKSAYNTDLVSGQNASFPTGKGKGAKRRKGNVAKTAETGAAQTSVKRETKEVREYARSHGVGRGGSAREDSLPTGQQPLLDPEAEDEGLLAFVQSVTCRRAVWAKVFESPMSNELTVPCCDICSPTLLDICRPSAIVTDVRTKPMKKGLPDIAARSRLRRWRLEIFERDHVCAQYDETAILNDDLLSTLTMHGPLTTEQLAVLLKGKWLFWDQYHHELADLIKSIPIAFTPVPTKPRTNSSKVPPPVVSTSATSTAHINMPVTPDIESRIHSVAPSPIPIPEQPYASSRSRTPMRRRAPAMASPLHPMPLAPYALHVPALTCPQTPQNTSSVSRPSTRQVPTSLQAPSSTPMYAHAPSPMTAPPYRTPPSAPRAPFHTPARTPLLSISARSSSPLRMTTSYAGAPPPHPPAPQTPTPRLSMQPHAAPYAAPSAHAHMPPSVGSTYRAALPGQEFQPAPATPSPSSVWAAPGTSSAHLSQSQHQWDRSGNFYHAQSTAFGTAPTGLQVYTPLKRPRPMDDSLPEIGRPSPTDPRRASHPASNKRVRSNGQIGLGEEQTFISDDELVSMQLASGNLGVYDYGHSGWHRDAPAPAHDPQHTAQLPGSSLPSSAAHIPSTSPLVERTPPSYDLSALLSTSPSHSGDVMQDWSMYFSPANYSTSSTAALTSPMPSGSWNPNEHPGRVPHT